MKIDYIVRAVGSDLSDLLAIHQTYFPGNQLATWETDNGIVVKVANDGEVSGMTFAEATTQIGWVDEVIKASLG